MKGNKADKKLFIAAIGKAAACELCLSSDHDACNNVWNRQSPMWKEQNVSFQLTREDSILWGASVTEG